MADPKALIIPAAGSGSRMRKETPKPYLMLEGCTILERTISAFIPLASLRQVVVATSEALLEDTRDLLKTILPDHIDGLAVVGGAERQHSIRNALDQIADEAELVLVHDAVRPFVEHRHIEACCQAASEVGAALLGVPSRDTIKHLDDQHMVRETPPRSQMWQAQTPQIFKKELLTEAYRRAEEEDFTATDDASLIERMGHPVKMVEGGRMNIKLTYPVDLELASLLIAKNRK
ncbi:2-C-methyl-D-erythritol 4-phosphate cytidylyltransferase [Fodinibius sediminis]|uniref:2-C-methyl-D-erythritol 4-phosphate cytidylyltransferase n=1 Tax=Fodinibius sediminis TaxID=1214077 RepID=A0A521CNM2_9BACT|nr:2-C-methyl-D-erythritol 4-phosphate cytidylyltransferase [Fodinibius sediminis]SMO60985.1 2-C-methyl-D-erythritol 4-phosphate cytidylyltransferase [Fodinibius sediminis]